MKRGMESPRFRVIIVGGSIAGLTLAHCLRRASIDHIVLEKREEISPQEGASIGLWPNGSQVLEQLGLYKELERQTEPLSRFHVSHPDGFTFSHTLAQTINERFGYPIIFLERQKLLETLYQGYPDKSQILLSKRVTEVRQTDNGACVVCEDGTTYQGSLVVGADGVHSRVRSEIWRLAEREHPGLITAEEKRGMTAEYACVFGISSAVPGLRSGEHVNVYGDGLTVLTFHGAGGRVYWFVINKMDRKYTYPDCPRFSTQDAAELCATRLAHVRIFKDVCVRDLWDNREVVSMTAMEETVFETWYLDRMVLLGDAIRKMTVNIGQGANSAIEDAAVLASLLNRLMKTKAKGVGDQDIKTLLGEFRALRYARTQTIYERSRFGVRFQTRDDLVKKFIGRYIIHYKRDRLADMASNLLADGAVVDFLPLPKRSGAGWERYKSVNRRDHRVQSRFLYFMLSLMISLSAVLLYRPLSLHVAVLF